MTLKRMIRVAALLLAAAWFSGCATVRAPVPEVSANPAVRELVDSAIASFASGQFAAGTAALERALRIEPKNPLLWQELAQAHLNEGNYQQAEGFAARANSWSGGNRSLLAANWRIISEARAGRGDDAGAEAALQRAMELE